MTECCPPRLTGSGLPGLGPDSVVFGSRHIEHPTNARPKNARLNRGLVASNAEKLLGAVRGEQDERNTCVMGLQHRGMQVGNRGAGGCHDGGGAAGLTADTERCEGRRTLVESHDEAQNTFAF
jgi:hypothetical protein